MRRLVWNRIPWYAVSMNKNQVTGGTCRGYFLLLSAFFLVIIFPAPAGAEGRICRLAFDSPAGDVLYTADGAVAEPRTSFLVDCTDEGVRFQFDAAKACDIPSELEMFFQPSASLPDGNYYQFYTTFADPDAVFSESERRLLARRGVPGDFHPSLRLHYSYFTERMPEFPPLKDFRTRLATNATGCAADILIPWNTLARILPFDEHGKGRQWRFGAFRSADKVRSAWQGQLHKAPTWGTLVFPDISSGQLAAIHRAIAVQNTVKTEPVIDSTLFDRDSIPGALAAQEKEREALAQGIPAAGDNLPLAEMRQLSAASDRMRTYREVLATFHGGTRMEWQGWDLASISTAADGTETAEPLVYTPRRGYAVARQDGQPPAPACTDNGIPAFDKKTQTAKSLRLSYVFRESVADAVRLTDLCAVVHGTEPRALRCTVTLNDRALIDDHDPAAAPVHIDLPEIARGDRLVVTLREAERLAARFAFFCRMETSRFGLRPRAPINHDSPGPLVKTLPVKKDNEYDLHHVAIYAGELSRLLHEKPRVIQFGGWFEIGFQLNAEPRRKELYDKYRLTHVGNIKDNNLETNLKLENYCLETLRPAMVILNANNAFSSDAERVCTAMRESIRIVREKSPDTRIVILGIVPRPNPAQLEKAKILSPVIAQLAEQSGLPYRDVFPVFLDAEGKVREELFLPVGYMTPEGYRRWTEILIPDLESTL